MTKDNENKDVKKRKFYYKGMTKEELKELNNDEVMKIIGARARRSLKRGLTKSQKDLMEKVEESNKLILEGKEQVKIKTHNRDMVIVPKMIDLKIEVHNGKVFEPVFVKQEMIGHYLGEFVLTRKKVQHGKTTAITKGEKSIKLK